MAVRMEVVLVGLFVSASAVAAAGDRQAGAPSALAAVSESPTFFSQGAPKSPYAKLFVGSTADTQPQPGAQVREATLPERAKVICGTLVIPADAGIDPRMRISRPPSDDTRHTMRVMKPPMCTSE